MPRWHGFRHCRIQTNWTRIPHMPSTITVATIPATTAPPTMNRSANVGFTPCDDHTRPGREMGEDANISDAEHDLQATKQLCEDSEGQKQNSCGSYCSHFFVCSQQLQLRARYAPFTAVRPSRGMTPSGVKSCFSKSKSKIIISLAGQGQARNRRPSQIMEREAYHACRRTSLAPGTAETVRGPWPTLHVNQHHCAALGRGIEQSLERCTNWNCYAHSRLGLSQPNRGAVTCPRSNLRWAGMEKPSFSCSFEETRA